MAEEEKKEASLVGSSSISSESNKRLGEDFMRRKRFSVEREDLRRIPLSMAAHKRMDNFEITEEPDCVPAIGLTIGGYSRFTGEDVTVTAWFCYKSRRLQWEIVEGPLKRRLSVLWDDIRGLELKLNESGLACLTVEVNHVPSCHLYTSESKQWWTGIRDFTDGEIQRNLPPHYVVFKPGIVDKCYEKFLNYRKKLAFLRAKHIQRSEKKKVRQQERAKSNEKKLLRRQEGAILREKKLQQILESKLHQQIGKLSTSESEKEENK